MYYINIEYLVESIKIIIIINILNDQKVVKNNLYTVSNRKMENCTTALTVVTLFREDQDDCALNNGGCSDDCIQGPFGAECICKPGYQLLNDSKTCEDINECLIPGFCSQQCYNERGTFRCYCSDGYLLEPDGRTCKVAGEKCS